MDEITTTRTTRRRSFFQRRWRLFGYGQVREARTEMDETQMTCTRTMSPSSARPLTPDAQQRHAPFADATDLVEETLLFPPIPPSGSAIRRTIFHPLPASPVKVRASAGARIVTTGPQVPALVRPPASHPKRGWHPLVWLGTGAIVTTLLLSGGTALIAEIAHLHTALLYGDPPTVQTDAVVGHADSSAHPSHFSASNVHGRILITELPGGDARHARIYEGPILVEPGSEETVPDLTFADEGHSGHPVMLLHLHQITIRWSNTGSSFIPEPSTQGGHA